MSTDRKEYFRERKRKLRADPEYLKKENERDREVRDITKQMESNKAWAKKYEEKHGVSPQAVYARKKSGENKNSALSSILSDVKGS